MATVANVAAGAAGAAAVLALVLTILAVRAWRVTRTSRNLYLAAAFVVSAIQAGVMAFLLPSITELATTWLLVPIAHAIAMLLLYVALLRV